MLYCSDKMVRTARTLVLLLAVAALFTAAGCGSDADGGTTVDAVVLTKAQFTKRANVICNKARQAALATPEGKDPIKEGILPAIQSAGDQLSTLEPPSADKAKVDEFVGTLEADIDRAMAAEVRELPELEEFFTDSAKLARSYGISGCAYAA